MVRTRAVEYEVAARSLRTRMDELAEAAVTIGRSAPYRIASGGMLRQTIDDALGVMIQQCRDAVGELDRVAQECARRAEVCREFEADWATYERHLDRWSQVPDRERGRAPVPPHAPARWVRP